MRIETQALGPIEIDDEKIMTFVRPMLGTDGAVRYALLDLNEESPVKLLQVTDEPEPCFLVADPTLFFPDYEVRIPAQEMADLQLEDPAKAAILVVLNVRREFPGVTANLLGPIVVNAEKFVAKQITLKGSGYRVDEPVPIVAKEG